MGEEKVDPVPGSPEITFQPVVKLALVKSENHVSDEDEIFKMRAKLYRYVVDLEDGPQWKERGVGEIKLLKHQENGACRVVMRRDKTLKLCANHGITANMELNPHASSEKAFVWNTMADFTDGEAKQETLAIRLRSIEDAKLFKEKFMECVKAAAERNKERKGTDSTTLPDLLSDLKVTDKEGSTETVPEAKATNGDIEKHEKTEEKQTTDEKSTEEPDSEKNVNDSDKEGSSDVSSNTTTSASSKEEQK